ncbi:MAG: ATP-binding protein [Ruminococcus sp.]|nr:ATP-binding protein [Ruminococcus sp.]
MTDLKNILSRVRTLVVFRGLFEDGVFAAFVRALESTVSGDADKAVNDYCAFASVLYEKGDDLTEYILSITLQDENIYTFRRGEGSHTGMMIEECLANELQTLEELSQIQSSEIAAKIGFDGFLPRYKTQQTDFSKVYADRMHRIGEFGYGAYSRHNVFMMKDGVLTPVEYPDPIRLSQLHCYETERSEVIENTLAFLAGKPANNVLLYGDCGTGKSSTVKAIANEYAPKGLRLIELKKTQLHTIPDIVGSISRNPLKFIVFIDDLSFTEDDDDFAALKAILEGSVSSTAKNLRIYATSNRRHLVRETFSSREGDEVHLRDTMQEFLSLSDRFGLTVTFRKPDKDTYLEVVEKLAEEYEVDMPREELFMRAERFALTKAGRSPRAAKQFIESVKGSAPDA